MEPKNPNPDPNARPVPFPLGRLAALLAGVLLLWGLAATPLPRGIAAVPEEVPSPSPSPSPVPAEPVRLLAVGDLMAARLRLPGPRSQTASTTAGPSVERAGRPGFVSSRPRRASAWAWPTPLSRRRTSPRPSRASPWPTFRRGW